VEFSLREFRPEDFEVLWSIDQRCFAPGIAYPRRELAAYIQRRASFTLVAESVTQPSITGFIVAEASRRVGHIITIDVLPENRRTGLGSKLLAAAEDRLLHAHCHSVVLETAVDNVPALAFYKRHQYSVLKVAPRYYSTGVDAFVLGKDLPA